MNRNIIGGSIVIFFSLIIGAVFLIPRLTSKSVFEEAPIPEAAADTSMSPSVDRDAFQIVYDEALLKYLSEDEAEMVGDHLANLFMDYLPGVIALEIDPDIYYENNGQEVERMTGAVQAEAFVSIYNKLLRIPEYQVCQVEVIGETLRRGEEGYYFDLITTFDDDGEVVWHVHLDRQDLAMIIN